jgi:hypothetical protein
VFTIFGYANTRLRKILSKNDNDDSQMPNFLGVTFGHLTRLTEKLKLRPHKHRVGVQVVKDLAFVLNQMDQFQKGNQYNWQVHDKIQEHLSDLNLSMFLE